MSKGNDLIEHPPVVAWIIADKNGFLSVTQSHITAEGMMRLGHDVTSLVRLSDYAALRASLSEALAEAEKKATSAEAIIGKFQSLVTNVEYWVAHGQSETATRAMIQARKEGWYEMGWRQHLQTYRYPPRDLSQGGQP